MAKSQTAIKASPLMGNVPTLTPSDFQTRFDAWLKQNEAAKPFHALRELAARITAGERKLLAAEQRGVSPDDKGYLAGVAKLAELRAERGGLTKTYQIPHFALATVHNFLRASRGWGLPDGSQIEIRIPGVFDIRVDLSESEIPF